MTRILRQIAAAGAGALLCLPAAAPAQVDAVRSSAWYLGTLKVDEAQEIAHGGAGITVAVLDTGVDASQQDLAGAVLPGIDNWSKTKDGRIDGDMELHGTGIAALIAGRGHGAGNADGILGIAPQARILPVGVWPPGTEDLRPDNLSYGIRWAVDHQADVICIAGGGAPDDTVREAIKYATDKNVPVVAAAGNNADKFVPYPASDRYSFAVSAVDMNGKAVAGFVTGDEIDFAAPGKDIEVPAPGGGYRTTSGTSFSAALLAGTLALIRERYPILTTQQLYNRLKATADDKGAPGLDPVYGYGVIDPVKALTATVPGEPAASEAASSPTPPEATAGEDGSRSGLIIVVVLVGVVLLAGIGWAVFRRRMPK